MHVDLGHIHRHKVGSLAFLTTFILLRVILNVERRVERLVD